MLDYGEGVPSTSMGFLMRYFGVIPSDSELESWTAECCKGDRIDRQLYLDKMITIMSEPCPICAENERKLKAYENYGLVTAEELRQILKGLENFNDEDLKEIMSEAKQSDNGLIDCGEFFKSLMSK